MASAQKDAKWEEARKRFHLSHEHVRMGKALGMNPAKLGKLANHKQEPWKVPLPIFIKACYEKHFNKPAKKPPTTPSSQKSPVQAQTNDNDTGQYE